MSERPTLSLSADHVRADGEAFLITMRPRMYPNENVNSGVSLNVIPPELVALNQPCPTCEGAGHLGHESWHTWHCPDCVNGRLVFDLKTPCDHLVMRQASNSQPICIRCMDDGTVSRRVWLDPEWGILPIRDGEVFDLIDIGSYDGPFPVVTFDPHENALIVYNSSPDEFLARPITLPSAARPGDCVARAVRAT